MTIKTFFHRHSDGRFTVQRIQDVEPILETNKVLQSIPQTRTDGLKHIASIPNVVIERWLKESGYPPAHEFNEFIRKKIRDPENRYLLTTGRL